MEVSGCLEGFRVEGEGRGQLEVCEHCCRHDLFMLESTGVYISIRSLKDSFVYCLLLFKL